MRIVGLAAHWVEYAAVEAVVVQSEDDGLVAVLQNVSPFSASTRSMSREGVERAEVWVHRNQILVKEFVDIGL